MLDVETIDQMSSIAYSCSSAKNSWSALIECEYFSDSSSEEIMNFARRFAKTVQFLMATGKDFSECIVEAAQASNLEKIGANQKFRALELLIAIWKYGDQLSIWSEKPANLYEFLTA